MIFQVDLPNRHCRCYLDTENRRKVYLIIHYPDFERYSIFEIGIDMDVYYLTKIETRDIELVHGRAPTNVNFYIAGLSRADAMTESGAIGFLISKIKESLGHDKLAHDVARQVEENMRKAILKPSS